MRGVVWDEGDVEEHDAGVDGKQDALPLGERRRVVRPGGRSPPGQDERGDGRGDGSVGNETAAVDGWRGGVGCCPRDKEAAAAGCREEEVQGGGGGGAGGHGSRDVAAASRCCPLRCLWFLPVSYPARFVVDCTGTVVYPI